MNPSPSNALPTVMLGDLPLDITHMIITSDPQIWRAMRLVATYYHQLLSWSAYVDKFTVVTTRSYIAKTGATHTVREWWLDGKLHREHDLPARTDTYG